MLFLFIVIARCPGAEQCGRKADRRRKVLFQLAG